ncbi:MAG: thiamine phosphate synthase [Colwellia sp.]|nr:thiamine phosphate synthase [Colwellia sp.]
MNKKIIWTISGSDCSGGAGIAADIKTAHGLGLEICSLITANTVQNSKQVLAVNPTEVAILQQQVDCLITDKPPSCIKIGLLVNVEQISWLCQVLAELKNDLPELKVIYDPVGQASVGGSLSTLTTNDLSELLPLIDVITPNLMEAQQLSQSKSNHSAQLAKSILALGVGAVIVKGGHGANHTTQCIDYCLTRENNQHYQLASNRINTNASHGGGCSFATALTCFLARGYLLRDAFTFSKAFINQGLNYSANKLEQESGYSAFEQLGVPTQAINFPKVASSLNFQPIQAFKTLGLLRGQDKKLGLYPVVDSIEWLKRLLPLGLEIIQLRVKNRTDEQLALIIQQAVALSQHYKTRLFINDYWQLAIEHGAYGVHIGQEDLVDTDINAINEAGLRLGISTHGCYEFLLAQQLKPSYLAIGAIFPTKTKDMTGQIQGIDNLSQILSLATDIPVVAIGGINLARAASVWQTGVDSIAVVTAITEAQQPEQAVEDFQCLITDDKQI